MTAEELIDKLKDYKDFKIIFSILEPDGSPYGIGLREFEIDVCDIGYSSKRIILSPTKEIN